ncbi:hypothetical protein Moror_13495 [Moniliophthora roreri MCA 2997]|uniref:Uncharacterized protein n=2 Tax=Moniliophthora roreri TaxID=221103 RepID=V2WQJ0_MONRO|nr:hypothetical protein Moror_13495 [Moniliophthora roreri MCA 2997]
MFSSRGAPSFNGRAPSSSGQAKGFVTPGPKGVSMRIFRQPTLSSSYPYATTAHFDVEYHNIDYSQPRMRTSLIGTSRSSEAQKQFHFPGSGINSAPPRSSDHRRSKTPSFSIIPSGMSKDMFIYEASNSEFSSSNTSLPLPFSPALSTDSTATVRSPDSPVDALPPHGFNRSSTPAPPKSSTFPLHIPALAQAQSGLRNVVSSDSTHSSQTSNISTQQSSGSAASADLRSFPSSERQEIELDRISRMNTEINAGYAHVAVNPPHPAAISTEPRTAPPQIYRDMPLRSSPDPFDAAFAAANAARNTADPALAAHPLPIPPIIPEQIKEQRGLDSSKVDRRNSYVPPAPIVPSISQSTTSTLDPNHPLLVAPGSMSTVQNTYQTQVPRSSSGSSEGENTSQRSSPGKKGHTRARTDSFASRRSNSPPTFPANASVASVPAPTGVEVPQQPRVEPLVLVTSQHQFPLPLPHLPSAVTMPVAQPSLPLLHIAHIPSNAPAQTAVVDAPPPVRSRTVSIETVSESNSERSGGERSPMIGIIQQIIQPAGAPDVSRRSRKTSVSTSPPSSHPLPVPPPTAASMGRPNSHTHTSQTSPSSATSSTATEPFTSSAPPPPAATTTTSASAPRSKTPGPKRSHSDGDNPAYAGASQRSATPFRSEFVPNVSAPPGRPPVPEPQRRFTDSDQHLSASRAPTVTVAVPATTRAAHSVRWKQELICPSPILPSQRRKGWFNRRGDQLWTNSGSYKSPPAGQEFPLDLASYPDYGEGWMNEDGVKIDMMHRLIPKPPLKPALKQPRA